MQLLGDPISAGGWCFHFIQQKLGLVKSLLIVVDAVFFLRKRDVDAEMLMSGPIYSTGLNVKKQIVLDGPVSCGKSIALAMLVHWARSEGWLVFYVPKGKDWTHGGFFYRNPHSDLWDTPVQATKILQVQILDFRDEK